MTSLSIIFGESVVLFGALIAVLSDDVPFARALASLLVTSPGPRGFVNPGNASDITLTLW